MGAQLPTKLRRVAEIFTELTGLEVTYSSVECSTFDLEIKESPLLKLLTFGYVLGLSVDVWANGDAWLNLRVNVKLRDDQQG